MYDLCGPNVREKAIIFIKDAQRALSRGVKHRDLSGRPLTTAKEIAEALLRDGAIEFETPANPQRP